MAIAIRGTPRVKTATGGTDITVDLPTGMQQGDVCLVFLGGTQNTGLLEVGGPTWTQLQLQTQGNAGPARGALYRKVMGVSPDVTATFTGTGVGVDNTVSITVAYSGVNIVTPEDTATLFTKSSATANPIPPDITTVTNNARVVVMAVSRVADSVIDPPTNYTLIASGLVATNDLVSTAMADRTVPVAGLESSGSFLSWASGKWVAFTLVLRPIPDKPRSFGVMVG